MLFNSNLKNAILLSTSAAVSASVGFADSLASNNFARAHVITMPLNDVVGWFEQFSTYDVLLPDGFRAQVMNQSISSDPDAFVSWLYDQHGLDHFRHGNEIYLTPLGDSVQRMILLEYLSVSDVAELLDSYQMSSATDVKGGEAQGANVAILTGPPEYIKIAESLVAQAEAMRTPAPQRQVSIVRGGVRQQDATTATLPQLRDGPVAGPSDD